MKKLLALLFVGIFSVVSMSFSKNIWEKVTEHEGVTISVNTDFLYDNKGEVVYEYYYFKYENTTNVDKTIQWKLDVSVNGNCRTCNLPSPNEYEMELIVKAGETLIQKDSTDDKRFVLFKKLPTSDKVLKFEYNKLKVK